MDKKDCSHEYELVRRFDANIEPQINREGSLSTITEEYKCKKCGHIKTVICPDEHKLT